MLPRFPEVTIESNAIAMYHEQRTFCPTFDVVELSLQDLYTRLFLNLAIYLCKFLQTKALDVDICSDMSFLRMLR